MRKLIGSSLAAGLLLLLAGAAQAQEEICGSIAAQPDAVYDNLIDELFDFLPIADVALCEKIEKSAITACHNAVLDTAGCLDSLVGSVVKTLKPACSTTKSPSFCNDDAKAAAAGDRADIEAAAEAAHEACHDEVAEAIFQACMEGFPM